MAASETHLQIARRPVTIESAPMRSGLTARAAKLNSVMWFSYRNVAEPADEDWVLRDVSFRISPGQTFAIVGHTARAKQLSFPCCYVFTTFRRGQFCWTAWTSASSICRICAAISDRAAGSVPLYRNYRGPTFASAPLESHAKTWTRHRQDRLGRFLRTLEEGIATPTNERGSTLSVGQTPAHQFRGRALAHNPRFLIPTKRLRASTPKRNC